MTDANTKKTRMVLLIYSYEGIPVTDRDPAYAYLETQGLQVCLESERDYDDGRESVIIATECFPNPTDNPIDEGLVARLKEGQLKGVLECIACTGQKIEKVFPDKERQEGGDQWNY